jgi:hypothetical protein
MTSHLKKPMLVFTLAALSLAISGLAQDQSAPAAPAPADARVQRTRGFDELADQALLAMKQRAEALKVRGVAVVAFVPGDETRSWSSKMLVVGQLASRSSSTNDPGSNLLAIAYSKASEMADTLKPSGSGVRPPMKGEFGWQGGWIARARNGYYIAAFSGGRSADDVGISKTGLGVFSGSL